MTHKTIKKRRGCTLQGRGRVGRQGRSSHRAQKEQEEEERVGMQVGLVELRGCDSPGGLGWGGLWCLAGEEDQKTGTVHRKEVQEKQGRGFPRICRGGTQGIKKKNQNQPDNYTFVTFLPKRTFEASLPQSRDKLCPLLCVFIQTQKQFKKQNAGFNHLKNTPKQEMELLPSAALHDGPCLQRSSLFDGVGPCHRRPAGGVDLTLIHAGLITSGRLTNLTGSALDARAAVLHLGNASCLALKISQKLLQQTRTLRSLS